MLLAGLEKAAHGPFHVARTRAQAATWAWAGKGRPLLGLLGLFRPARLGEFVAVGYDPTALLLFAGSKLVS